MNFDKSQSGVLLCAKYAFMPNKLQYCGGDQNAAIFELTAINDPDGTLNFALREFETLYPYLKLIAAANKISDPFDPAVVEAYWLGNELLNNVQMKNLYNHFVDGLKLKKRMKLDQFENIVAKIPRGAIPHHSFHVFNIWQRTGHTASAHTIETMDNCRIGWGKIIDIGENELVIETKKLQLADAFGATGTATVTVQFSPPQIKKIIYKMFGESFIKNPQIGDWVSCHWGWACDVLTLKQVENLKKYTLHNLALANLAD